MSLNAVAGAMGVSPKIKPYPWSVIASLGYTNYQSMYSRDGQTVLGRLALSKEMFTTKQLGFGLELGIQNGNTMRLKVSQPLLNRLGGLPIQSTVKPMADLLVTVKEQILGSDQFFGVLKGGIAYRQWQFDNRSSINSLSNIAGEIQAGIGYPISQMTSLSLLYQAIIGGDPDFRINPINATASVSTIPIQQSLLLSISLVL
jgi:hypothetical protein